MINLNFRSWVLAYPVESLRNEMGKEHTEALVMLSMNCLKLFISTVFQNSKQQQYENSKSQNPDEKNPTIPSPQNQIKIPLHTQFMLKQLPTFLWFFFNRKKDNYFF